MKIKVSYSIVYDDNEKMRVLRLYDNFVEALDFYEELKDYGVKKMELIVSDNEKDEIIKKEILFLNVNTKDFNEIENFIKN